MRIVADAINPLGGMRIGSRAPDYAAQHGSRSPCNQADGGNQEHYPSSLSSAHQQKKRRAEHTDHSYHPPFSQMAYEMREVLQKRIRMDVYDVGHRRVQQHSGSDEQRTREYPKQNVSKAASTSGRSRH